MNRGKGRCHKEKEGKRRRNRRELEGGVRASRRAQREDVCTVQVGVRAQESDELARTRHA